MNKKEFTLADLATGHSAKIKYIKGTAFNARLSVFLGNFGEVVTIKRRLGKKSGLMYIELSGSFLGLRIKDANKVIVQQITT